MAAPSKQWASQAKINALLRYSPQREALANLTQEARSQYESSIKGAESSGRLTSQAVEAAKPQVSGVYDRAQASTGGTQSQLAAALAALGPAATGFKAAAATTGAAGQEKEARERASAESGLEAQDVAAKEAPAFARTLANQQLATSLSKIFSSTQNVASNEGAATASELGKLEDEAEGRAVTERGQNLSSQSSAAGRSQKAAEHQEDLALKRDALVGSGAKYLAQSKQTAAASTVREIEKEARALHGAGLGRSQLLSELTNAHPGTNVVKRDESGKPIKNSKGEVQYEKAPALKAHDDLLTEAALDSVLGYGRVSRATLAKLHAAGYSVTALGLQGPAPAGQIQQVQSTAPGSRIAAERRRVAASR